MAKVLACPSCGHKHPLDSIPSGESFPCVGCAKKLAVPDTARKLITPSREAEQPKEVSHQAQTPRSENVHSSQVDSLDDEDDIVIIARASLSLLRDEKETKREPHAELQKQAVDTVAARSGHTLDDETPRSRKRVAPDIVSIPIIGRFIEWIVAVPAGFLLVVILPRIFGFGFHASDFVDVITTQGIGRYKIVVALVLLWSVATVACIGIFNSVIRRLLRVRKHAV